MWKVGVGVAGFVFVILTYCALFRRLSVPERDPSLLLILPTVLGFSVFYGTLTGFAVGLVNAGRRLVGNKFYFMLLPISLATLITVCLFLYWLDHFGKETVNAMSTSAANYGLTETSAGLDGERLFTTSRFLQLLPPVKVLFCPFLVTDSLQVLVDNEVLWQYYLFLRAGMVAVLLGLIPSYLLSLGLLFPAGFARLRARYEKFMANYGVITTYSS
jgi:hypothetical protein